MSTRCTIAIADVKEAVGGEEFHESLHFFMGCFDEDPVPVYLEAFQQCVFGDRTDIYVIPHDQAVALFKALGEWAAKENEK